MAKSKISERLVIHDLDVIPKLRHQLIRIVQRFIVGWQQAAIRRHVDCSDRP